MKSRHHDDPSPQDVAADRLNPRQTACARLALARGVVTASSCLDVVGVGTPRRTLQYDLARMVDAGILIREGAGPSSRYRPGPRLRDDTDPPAAAERARPAAPLVTSLVEREAELATVVSKLDDHRLVTLTGAAGMGKTRLALEVARTREAGYRNGVASIEMSVVRESSQVTQAAAAALLVRADQGRPLIDCLAGHLRHRHMLIVVDNCEHVASACADLIRRLLAECPMITFLTTSQEPLGVPEEEAWSVPPLTLPVAGSDRAQQLRSGAVQLFWERAVIARPGFVLNGLEADAVAEICRHLDGIPLAIELAAARVNVISPAEIASRLDDRFSLLRGGTSPLRPHHHTLRGALNWSYDLLSEPERMLLRCLSVFVGGLTLEAAEIVCASGKRNRGQLLDSLSGLASKSLVTAITDEPTTRYRLLETIRLYARERLAEAGEERALLGRHAHWYLAFAERAEPELTGANQEEWLEAIEADADNLRAALSWFLKEEDAASAMRLAGALTIFWRVRGHFENGRRWLHSALELNQPAAPEIRGKALWGAGFLTLMLGEVDSAIDLIEQSRCLARERRDAGAEARALLLLGNAHQLRDPGASASFFERSTGLARQAGDAWCLAHALGLWGWAQLARGDVGAGRVLLEECLEVARRTQDKQSLRIGLMVLGDLALRQGEYATADDLLSRALEVARQLGDTFVVAAALTSLGDLARGRGDYQRAGEVLGESLALSEQSGAPALVTATLSSLGMLAHARRDPSSAEQRFEEAISLAREVGLDCIPALRGLGEIADARGDRPTARGLLDRALSLARARGDKREVAAAMSALGGLAGRAGDARGAAALLHGALEVRDQIRDARGVTDALEGLAAIAAGTRPDYAARLFGAVRSLRAAHGYVRTPDEEALHRSAWLTVCTSLGEGRCEELQAQGARLGIEAAVALARKGRGTRSRARSGWASLTPAERDVVALVADGLSNAQIAKRLFISPRTVEAHLSRVFAKLDVDSRTQLAREAFETGLPAKVT